MNRRTMPAVAFLFAALMIVAAACSSNDGDSVTALTSGDAFEESSDRSAPTTAAPATTAAAFAPTPESDEGRDAGAGSLGNGGIAPTALQPADIGRDIIFTADLTVAVTDVARAGQEATSIIESLGGLMFGQQSTGDPEPTSVLIFKVFPADFQEALTRLGSVGDIRTQNVSADDVTERIVDLESRISTSEASVDRLRGFLEEATDLKTIAELESQLLDRETRLETLRGQLRTVRDRVDLATIVLTLIEALSRPGIGLEVTAYPGHDDAGLSCPGSGALTVEQDEDVTVCFEITNTGDTTLTGLELGDSVLEVELADLVAVFGEPTGPIEPGQSIVLATEIVAERTLRTRTRIEATPVDEEGTTIGSRMVATVATMFVDAEDPGGLPGFGDGLDASRDILVGIGGLLVLIAGASIPFVWVLGLIALYWWWRRRREDDTTISPPPDAPPGTGSDPEDGATAGNEED